MGAPGGGTSKSSSASSSRNAENLIWSPAVPRNDASLPASVLMLYLGVAANAGARLDATSAAVTATPRPILNGTRNETMPGTSRVTRTTGGFWVAVGGRRRVG